MEGNKMRGNFHAIPNESEVPLAGFGDRDARCVSSGPVSVMPKHVGDGTPTAGEIAYRAGEVRDLRAEVDRLRSERDRLLATQRTIMDLLHAPNAERLIHDLRNVLNERELYKALADTVVD